jgi:hypothetical protein
MINSILNRRKKRGAVDGEAAAAEEKSINPNMNVMINPDSKMIKDEKCGQSFDANRISRRSRYLV